MTPLIWFAIVDAVLGALIVALIFLFYRQGETINKLKVAVKALIGKQPKHWNKLVKNDWKVDDE